MVEVEGGNSNKDRLQLIVKSIELAVTHPLGVGVGNARHYLTEYGEDGFNHVENEYLQVLVEQSVIGLIAFVMMLWGVVFGVLRRANRSSHQEPAAWVGWAFAGILLDWSIYGLFNVLHDNAWFWPVIGLAIAWVRLAEVRQSTAARLNTSSYGLGALPVSVARHSSASGYLLPGPADH
jgi:O-antigen ligase